MTPVSAETDLTADDDAGRRGARRLPLLGVILAGVLLLSACGGSPEEDGQAGSEDPSASASEIDDSFSGEESPSGGESSDGDGSGEPVPASSEGPAQNWPKPEEPDDITKKSEEGAEATLEYWWDLHAYGRNTGDLAPLAELSTSDCEFCTNRVDASLGVYDQGDWWSQEPYEIEDFGLAKQDDGVYEGGFVLNEGDFVVYHPDDDPDPVDGKEGHTWGAQLVYLDGAWRVADLSHQFGPSGSEGGS